MICTDCKISCYVKPLYRSNPKGEKAIWKCQDCLETPIPNKELAELCDVIVKGEKYEN